jgi:hypothetical protein
MRRLAQHSVTSYAELTGERVEPRGVRFTQGGYSLTAIAIKPAHVTRTLPRDFDQIAQKVLFRFG